MSPPEVSSQIDDFESEYGDYQKAKEPESPTRRLVIRKEQPYRNENPFKKQPKGRDQTPYDNLARRKDHG